jgi:toluene monooxygenase electron transfer component
MTKIDIPAANLAFDCDDNDTILRAALRAGLGFPYECNVGTCGNCKFELMEGEVSHLRTDAPGWSERDKQRNRYLGCQAKAHGACKIKVSLRDHYKSHHRPQKVKGTLVAIADITHDIREFRFRLSTPQLFLPGQYALIYAPHVEGGRAYSMSNITGTGEEWHFQIRRVPNGAATTVLFDQLAIGDSIDLDGPYGMAYLREEAPRDLLLLAGGSGLSPMISLSRGAIASKALAGRKVHFIYGGRTAKDIAGEDMLRELEGFGERLHYYPVVSAQTDGTWTGETGFVHEVAAKLFSASLANYEIYFAGPPLMADAITKLVVEHKVPMTQVHFDQFS